MKDWGHLFENLIYLDLRRQEKKIYYYLTNDRYEVDFLTIDLEGKRETGDHICYRQLPVSSSEFRFS